MSHESSALLRSLALFLGLYSAVVSVLPFSLPVSPSSFSLVILATLTFTLPPVQSRCNLLVLMAELISCFFKDVNI